MSHYVYGEINVECEPATMVKVLESLVPEWVGKIEFSDTCNIKLKSNYEQAKNTYHIRVPNGSKGISYEDFGMRMENGKWTIASGNGHKIGSKTPSKFKEELAGEIGKFRAKKVINKMKALGLVEEEDGEEFVFKFNIDRDSLKI